VSTLARIQADFLAAAIDASQASRAPAVRGGRMPPAERLAIYRRNLHANWRGALADTFPVVARLVGESFFAEAARRYALAHPSSSGDLHRFGAGFPDFAGAYPHARDLPYLRDVARLEWAWHESFHAGDAPPMDLAALARVPGDRHGDIRFTLHPAARLVDSEHPILAIWEANQPERDGTPGRFEGADTVIVHRPALDVQVGLLERVDWRFLRALELGDPLEAAAQRAGYEDAAELGLSLQRFRGGRVSARFPAPPRPPPRRSRTRPRASRCWPSASRASTPRWAATSSRSARSAPSAWR
jgi:hypothetical protein